jgi:hypothetical protein
MFTDQSGTQIFDNYTFFAGFPQFIVRSGGDLVPAGLTWGQLGFCYAQGAPVGGDCNGIVMNGIRYDTPVFAGFSASASWGEDDFWEVAARYTGEAAGFKILLGVGYSEFTDEGTTVALPAGSVKDTNVFQAGGYVQHLATGLFVHAAYGHEDNNDTRIWSWRSRRSKRSLVCEGRHPPEVDRAGCNNRLRRLCRIRRSTGAVALSQGATSSTMTRYGGGIAQEIDAAAMTVYLKYQRYEADVTGLPAALGSWKTPISSA